MKEPAKGQSKFSPCNRQCRTGRMRLAVTLILLFVALVASQSSPYKPRGWRPNGQQFNPGNGQAHGQYGPPPEVPAYGPPEERPNLPTTTTTTTTAAPRRSITTKRPTTTPRTREPTTPSEIPEEDFESNPALAIANSFAFNKPVYVYTSFPFLPGQALVK